MGQVVLPNSGTVYVDTSAVIYHAEQIEPYFTVAMPLWDALDAQRQQVVTSSLTLLEVLVKPLRDGNEALANLYRQVLLGTLGLDCLPIDRAVLESAAQLRAAHQLKTPDAIHAATALAHGCTLFVTNDVGFRRVPNLPVVVLGELAAS